jgi:EAL domain-containing protein (putative c-di-GMP-specific phosphodiesterase class I)
VSPAEFIPIAEETGLIVQLGAWVLDHACTQLASWQQHHPQHKDLLMTVNVSGLQIMQPDIVSQVADILARTGVTPSCVALEITESVLMRDAEDILTVLHDLQRLGVQLKVDDFGTGFSSLSYLKRFPVDALKIDQSFVSGLGTDRDDEAIVQAILALGRSLGMRTVAEGIETHQQLAALRAFGGELGQGFLFSRPKPAHQLKLILQRGQILPAGLPTQRDKRYPAAISSRL